MKAEKLRELESPAGNPRGEMKPRQKTVKLKVRAIRTVYPLGAHWWARVDATGPKGTTTIDLGFDTEAEAYGCLGLVFKQIQNAS